MALTLAFKRIKQDTGNWLKSGTEGYTFHLWLKSGKEGYTIGIVYYFDF